MSLSVSGTEVTAVRIHRYRLVLLVTGTGIMKIIGTMTVHGTMRRERATTICTTNGGWPECGQERKGRDGAFWLLA